METLTSDSAILNLYRNMENEAYFCRMDVYGQALSDYYQHKPPATLWINNSYAEPEEMPVEIFFRNDREMPELEIKALEHCKGKILDIGAGAGSHALYLQQRGLDVTALEISAAACRIMEQRGVKKVINTDIFSYATEKYDTLLLLMNGIGLCGSIKKLKVLLNHFKTLLNKDGQLIFDSSDVSYLYEKDDLLPSNRYFGEISFQYQYKGQKGDWFDWLYVDSQTLETIAEAGGWNLEILFEDDQDQYLARLTVK